MPSKEHGCFPWKEASKLNLWPPKIMIRYFVTLPLGLIPRNAHASLKLLPKTQWEKKGSEKEYMAHASYVALVASLKTLRDKTQWEKSPRKKEYNNLSSGLVLIFGINMSFEISYYGLWFRAPRKPCISLSRVIPMP